jgi:hypothetical protein
VIVLVVVVATAMVALDGMGWLVQDPDPHVDIHLVLASPSVTTRGIANVTHWDAVLDIQKVTPQDSRASWVGIEITVEAEDGSELLVGATPQPDHPFSYDDAANGWVDVEVWFIEATPVDVFVDVGDAIVITGMDDRYEGASIVIRSLGDQIGKILLPLNFP